MTNPVWPDGPGDGAGYGTAPPPGGPREGAGYGTAPPPGGPREGAGYGTAPPPVSPADPPPRASGPGTSGGHRRRRRGRDRYAAVAVAVAVVLLAVVVGLVIWAPWRKPPLQQPTGLAAGARTTSSVAFHWSGPAT